MSATKQRLPSREAAAVAKRFLALIEGSCDRIVVAGSLRRRLPTCGDVEIVALPKIGARPTDMFADVTAPVDLLHERLDELLATGVVEKRPRSDGAVFWGPRAKYLTFEGVPFDLFSVVNDWRGTKQPATAEPDRFGIILVIRTGPSGYSHRLVTPKDQKAVVGYHANKRPILKPGLLPTIYRQVDGWLTFRTSGERIPTPEEADVFRLLGLEYLEPWERHP